jgi:hypothetical protein
MANEERIAQLQTALDELVEPVPISDKEIELRSEDGLVSAKESFDRAVSSYEETKARIEGKLEAEKAIEDLPLPDDSVEEESEEETEEEE